MMHQKEEVCTRDANKKEWIGESLQTMCNFMSSNFNEAWQNISVCNWILHIFKFMIKSWGYFSMQEVADLNADVCVNIKNSEVIMN